MFGHVGHREHRGCDVLHLWEEPFPSQCPVAKEIAKRFAWLPDSVLDSAALPST